jgi:hypothetical protein
MKIRINVSSLLLFIFIFVINISLSAQIITKINDYELNQNIDTMSSLEEFTAENYKIAEQNGLTRLFNDDKFYWINQMIYFAATKWEPSFVVTNKSIIYKICIFKVKATQSDLDSIYSYLKEKMGEPNKPLFRQDHNIYAWDDSKENLILDADLFNKKIVIYVTGSEIIDKIKK